MIVLTRLNRSRFALNPDLIERIQATPDTTIVMVDGATFIVLEDMHDVIAQIEGFRARVLATAAAYAGAPVDEIADQSRPTTDAVGGPTDEPEAR